MDVTDARDRLLDAAHARLADGGYAAMTVAEVARDAGVATGSVYRYFPSKADLATAVFRRAVGPEVIAVAAATEPGPPATTRLAAGVETFIRRAAATPKRAYALLAEPVVPELEHVRHAYRDAYAQAFDAVLRDGVRDGELEPCDTELVAAAIVGALGEALFGALVCRRPVDVDGLVLTLQSFVVSAARPRSADVPA
jgi:AcrR family transcriptional regulator